jgi:hypothetical protein
MTRITFPVYEDHLCERARLVREIVTVQVLSKGHPNLAPAIMFFNTHTPMSIAIPYCPFCGVHLHPGMLEVSASNRPLSATMGPVRDSGPKFAIGQYRSAGEQAPSPNLHLFVDQRAVDLGAEFPVEGGHYPDVTIEIKGTKLIYHVRNPDTGVNLTGELTIP